MPKLFLTLVLMIVSTGAWSKGSTWYLLNVEKGCVALHDLYEDFPYLRGGTNPDQIFKLFRKRYEDATLQPFVDVLAASHEKNGSVPSAEERDSYKKLTSSNAFLISSNQSGIEMLLMTKVACSDLGGVVDK